MSVTSIQQRNGAPCENCGNPKCVGGSEFKAIEERLAAAEKACVDRVAQVAFGEVCARCTRRGCQGSACAPCDHCGGEIGPDITGRPCCYRCCSKSEELRGFVPADKLELPPWMEQTPDWVTGMTVLPVRSGDLAPPHVQAAYQAWKSAPPAAPANIQETMNGMWEMLQREEEKPQRLLPSCIGEDPDFADVAARFVREYKASHAEAGPGIAALKLPAPRPTLDMSAWTDETDLLPDER